MSLVYFKMYPVLHSESEAEEAIRILNNEMSHITRGGLGGQRTYGILKVKMSTCNLPLKYTNFMVVWLQVPGMLRASALRFQEDQRVLMPRKSMSPPFRLK